jgi:hypothetical protein
MSKPSRFYHFTHRLCLENILREGLRPSPGDLWCECGVEIPPYTPCVWLTAQKTNDLFAAGGPLGVCLTVNLLPSKRLTHWATWLEKHEPDFFAALNAAAPFNTSWHAYWHYRGVITPDKFTAIEVNPAKEVSYAVGDCL